MAWASGAAEHAHSAPTHPGRSAALDALRALAALMVVGTHTLLLVPVGAHPNPVLNLVREHLWTAVDLFFALSGFLIAGPYIRALIEGRSLPPTGGYLVRRAGRIVPAYWVALTAFLLLVHAGVVGQRSLPGGQPSGAGTASHYLLIHNWLPGQSRAVFTVAWTLSIEALFYLFVPFAAALLRRRHPGPISQQRLLGLVAALAAASLAWAVLWGLAFDHLAVLRSHPGWYTVIRDNLPARLGLFCPGMLLAVLLARNVERGASQRRWREWWRSAPSGPLMAAAVAVWIAGVAAGGHLGHTFAALRDSLFMPVAWGLPLLVFLRGGPVVRMVSRVFAPVGVVSYGLYLWHWVVVGLLDHGPLLHLAGGPWFAWILALLIVCALSLPLAVASWLFVERPVLRATAAWAQRRRALPVPASTARVNTGS